MKITIGSAGRPVRVMDIAPGTPVSSEFIKIQGEIRSQMLGKFRDKIVSVSPDRLRTVAEAITEAANQESLSLFDRVAERIGVEPGRPGTMVNAIFSHQLSGPFDDPGGRLQWHSLSQRYSDWKTGVGHRLNKNRRRSATKVYHTGIHDLTGTMKRYFERSGKVIVQNRFGGIHAEIDLRGLKEGMKPKVEDASYGDTVGLGRINIKIFPRLSPHLMPQLASRRWYSAGEWPALEREILPPRTADKLSGGQHGPIRPLVLPVVQFYILHRIPGAVNRIISKQFSTTLRTRRNSP